jgi:hypothetical protein
MDRGFAVRNVIASVVIAVLTGACYSPAEAPLPRTVAPDELHGKWELRDVAELAGIDRRQYWIRFRPDASCEFHTFMVPVDLQGNLSPIVDRPCTWKLDQEPAEQRVIVTVAMDTPMVTHYRLIEVHGALLLRQGIGDPDAGRNADYGKETATDIAPSATAARRFKTAQYSCEMSNGEETCLV